MATMLNGAAVMDAAFLLVAGESFFLINLTNFQATNLVRNRKHLSIWLQSRLCS
jgi:hypothetical protein